MEKIYFCFLLHVCVESVYDDESLWPAINRTNKWQAGVRRREKKSRMLSTYFKLVLNFDRTVIREMKCITGLCIYMLMHHASTLMYLEDHSGSRCFWCCSRGKQESSKMFSFFPYHCPYRSRAKRSIDRVKFNGRETRLCHSSHDCIVQGVKSTRPEAIEFGGFEAICTQLLLSAQERNYEQSCRRREPWLWLYWKVSYIDRIYATR